MTQKRIRSVRSIKLYGTNVTVVGDRDRGGGKKIANNERELMIKGQSTTAATTPRHANASVNSNQKRFEHTRLQEIKIKTITNNSINHQHGDITTMITTTTTTPPPNPQEWTILVLLVVVRTMTIIPMPGLVVVVVAWGQLLEGDDTILIYFVSIQPLEIVGNNDMHVMQIQRTCIFLPLISICMHHVCMHACMYC